MGLAPGASHLQIQTEAVDEGAGAVTVVTTVEVTVWVVGSGGAGHEVADVVGSGLVEEEEGVGSGWVEEEEGVGSGSFEVLEEGVGSG
jgi:hypothetical protein